MSDEREVTAPREGFFRRIVTKLKDEVGKQAMTGIVAAAFIGLSAIATYVVPSFVKDRFQDPRKAIVEKGLPWDEGGLYRSIFACGDGDLDAVKLYRRGGMDIEKGELWRVLAMAGRDRPDGSVRCLDVYKDQFSTNRDRMCTRATSSDYIPGWLRSFPGSAVNFLVEGIRNPAKKAHIEGFCGVERMKREFADLYG